MIRIKSLKNIIYKFSFLLILLLYSIISIMGKSPSLPSISKIFFEFINVFLSQSFYVNLLYTVKIVITGTAIAFFIGVIIAIICTWSRIVNILVMPIINMTKNIPSIALFPLFIVLMGIGDAPRIFVIIWNSIYPIISTTYTGITSVDKEIIEAAQNCGATELQLYRYIKMPLSFLYILNGLKISAGNGFIAIVVAEMLGATKGLGYMILWSANSFQYSQMYVYILVIALIGLFINVIIDKIISFAERRIYYAEEKNHSIIGHGFIRSICNSNRLFSKKVSR